MLLSRKAFPPFVRQGAAQAGKLRRYLVNFVDLSACGSVKSLGLGWRAESWLLHFKLVFKLVRRESGRFHDCLVFTFVGFTRI
jgi:hypothetical protein